jgi:hypothetical protein|tara:strand:- start:254 stop:1882 length:1629 start_codon:yes stop_codon:yes gene_type:complete
MSKKDEELANWLASEDPTVNTNDLSQWLNSEETDPSIPSARFEAPDNRISRELTTTQKGLNKLTKILGGGGVGRPYKEDVTAQELEYENINPLYATYETGKSLAGDVGALGSAAGGYAADIFTSSPYFPFNMGDREITPFMDRVGASNFFKPDVTKKGQNYRQKFDENIPAIGGLNQLASLSRLKPVVGAPNQISTFKYNPANKIKQGVNVVKNEASDIASSIGSKIPKTLMGNETRTEAIKQSLLRSGIKPTQKQQVKMQTYGGNSAYDDAVEVIYRDNITLNPKGIQKIKDNAALATKNIDDFIEQNKKIKINKDRIFNNPELQKIRQRYIDSVDGGKDLKAFDAVIESFAKDNKGKVFTIKDAQKIKTNTYSILNKKAYSKETTLSSADEAKKYVARILKEEIEKSTTRLGIDGKQINVAKDLNREAQRYINALDVVTKREFVSGRSNPIHGLALLAHDPMLMAGSHLQASTPFKVNLARTLNSLQKNKPTPIRNEAGYISGMVKDAMTQMSPFDNIRAAGLLQNEPEELYQSLLRKKQ